ncbi:hypothetical protein BWU74_03230 [Paraburkholderia caledonica]|nr:hypothetical protein BWU74_03230 [Burkholderia sp. Bk]
MMNATSAAGRRGRNRFLSGYRPSAGASCGTLTDWSSHRGVTKQRPHPGTTILFCAIKENPRRKNCCIARGLVWPGTRRGARLGRGQAGP